MGPDPLCRPPPAITLSADVEGHLEFSVPGDTAASASPCSPPPAHVFLMLLGWITGHVGCTCCHAGGGPEEEVWHPALGLLPTR